MITSFSGQYGFLSNFDTQPIVVRDITWKGNEVWFHFAKKLRPDQTEITTEDLIALRRRINGKDIIIPWTDLGPRDAKRLGRNIKLRSDWEQVKEDIMLEGLRAKFTQTEQYRKALIRTYPADLVEGNTWHDNYWGVCTCSNCLRGSVIGKNRLGVLLGVVRDELLGAQGRANISPLH